MKTAFWRRWHRWIGFPAAVFLLFAAVTGFIVATTEFFGEAEALREATRDMTSPVTTAAQAPEWSEPIARAMALAGQRAPGAPVDRITAQFKGDQPTVTIYLGKPGGGEDRLMIVDARTGSLIKEDVYADKPFINRLHSGEWFGDGGLVFAMFWALALAVLTISGLIIYWTMRRRNAVGLQKVFW
ncbi:MAG TPA: PepSY-associated TM helix domain-containing protein [Vicinamibacterales bacterium]|nr:PepSY-associated TM helix domain-containing protein [Vicinamibacterales bacterium]